MTATIWIRGKDGSHQHLMSGNFEDGEWKRLKEDWLAYLREEHRL